MISWLSILVRPSSIPYKPPQQAITNPIRPITRPTYYVPGTSKNWSDVERRMTVFEISLVQSIQSILGDGPQMARILLMKEILHDARF